MSRICSAVGEALVTTLNDSGRGSGNPVVWRSTPPSTRVMSTPCSFRNGPRVRRIRKAPFFLPFKISSAWGSYPGAMTASRTSPFIAFAVGEAERRWERPTVSRGEVVEDRGIVSGRVLKRLEGQFLPQLPWDRFVVAPCLEHVAVAGRTHDHGDPRGVFRRRPDQGDPADVDVLYGLIDGDVRLGYGRFERIQVHDDEIDRDRAQVLEVLLVTRRRENSREDPGMQRLHATAESFAQARVVRDGRHGESRFLQDLRGPVRADQLKAEVPQTAGEIDQALLVRYAEERPRGRNHPYYRVPIGNSQ